MAGIRRSSHRARRSERAERGRCPRAHPSSGRSRGIATEENTGASSHHVRSTNSTVAYVQHSARKCTEHCVESRTPMPGRPAQVHVVGKEENADVSRRAVSRANGTASAVFLLRDRWKGGGWERRRRGTTTTAAAARKKSSVWFFSSSSARVDLAGKVEKQKYI